MRNNSNNNIWYNNITKTNNYDNAANANTADMNITGGGCAATTIPMYVTLL